MTTDSKKLWSIDFLAECGFKLGNASDAFMVTFAALGWENFVKNRISYFTPVVLEFYADIPEPNEGMNPTYSVVRKVRVHFYARTINELYKLGYNCLNFERKCENWGKS